MIHPEPFVVQVEITALQASSVVNVTGSKAQVIEPHVVVIAFQAHVTVDDPNTGILLQSDAVVNPLQVDGFDLH